MGILDSITSVFGGGGAPGRDTRKTYIVDGERFAGGRDGGDRVSPVERVQVLQKLGRFATREEIRMVVVLMGRPLREVAHGDEFNGVKVFYAEQGAKLAEEIVKHVRSARRRGGVMVVTSDRATEEQAREAGAETMRITTLRKGMESPEGDGEQGGRPQRRRRSQPRREQQPRQQASSEQEGKQGQEKPAPSKPADTTVNNLIDLVE